MRCSTCGTENRAEVRFCRKCGQPLTGAPPPALEGGTAGIICPSCGTTVKAGMDFCPRCGRALDLAAAPVSTPVIEDAPPHRPPTARPPVVVAPEDAAFKPSASRLATIPRTFGIVLSGLLLVLCVGLILITLVTLAREGKLSFLPGLSPTATATPTVVFRTPTATVPSLPSPTPTVMLVVTQPLTLTADMVDAVVVLDVSTKMPRIGEQLLFTITFTNTGEAPLSRMRFTLDGQWAEVLAAREFVGPLVERPGPLLPGEQEIVVFSLDGRQLGLAQLWAGVTFEVQVPTPYLERRISEKVLISVMP